MGPPFNKISFFNAIFKKQRKMKRYFYFFFLTFGDFVFRCNGGHLKDLFPIEMVKYIASSSKISGKLCVETSIFELFINLLFF